MNTTITVAISAFVLLLFVSLYKCFTWGVARSQRPQLRLVRRIDTDYKGSTITWEIHVGWPGNWSLYQVAQCVGTYQRIPARFTSEEVALRYLQAAANELDEKYKTVVTYTEVLKTVY